MHHQQQHGGRDVWRLTILLCLAWVGTLLYGEFFAFSIIPHCSWPAIENSNEAGYGHKLIKIAVIADPQHCIQLLWSSVIDVNEDERVRSTAIIFYLTMYVVIAVQHYLHRMLSPSG
ncbi:hypothetical protein AMTR_s00131p00027490 [Amborella trichopoda]|uniref:Uncharacterized protein n=1 Tax=Amborella trichopoda TaxID=13333 RepID=W1NR16_AMBTC|nr:hypothetical protein AMTR_s00131p00027490 [Amborella trichopoda]